MRKRKKKLYKQKMELFRRKRKEEMLNQGMFGLKQIVVTICSSSTDKNRKWLFMSIKVT
jgi:hypothetical protein